MTEALTGRFAGAGAGSGGGRHQGLAAACYRALQGPVAGSRKALMSRL